MSSRAERKEAAAACRREWHVRWADIGLSTKGTETDPRRVVELIANDAADLIKKTPQMRSEVESARLGFIDLLTSKVVADRLARANALQAVGN